MDCSDFTDEKNCKRFSLDADYLKDKLPPPLPGRIRAEVYFDVNIVSILNIDVVKGVLQLQLEVSTTWRDPRLKF